MAAAAVNLLCVSLALLALIGCAWSMRELVRTKAKYWEAAVAAEEWAQKYRDLREEVRKKAMEPLLYKDANPRETGARKARSSAEVRRMFEEVNGREA